MSDTHIYKIPIGVHFLNTCIPMLNLPFIFVIQYLCWNLHCTQKHSPLHLESVYCLYSAFYCHKVSCSLMTNYLHDFLDLFVIYRYIPYPGTGKNEVNIECN